MANKEPEVRFGVYDSFKNWLGYKSDSSWDLSKKHAKAHPLDQAGRASRLIKSLLFFINGGFCLPEKPYEVPFDSGHYDKTRSFYVIPELVKNRRKLAEICIAKGKDGAYEVQ